MLGGTCLPSGDKQSALRQHIKRQPYRRCSLLPNQNVPGFFLHFARLACQRLPRAAHAAALSCFSALVNSIKRQTNGAVVRHRADNTCQSVTPSQRQIPWTFILAERGGKSKETYLGHLLSAKEWWDYYYREWTRCAAQRQPVTSAVVLNQCCWACSWIFKYSPDFSSGGGICIRNSYAQPGNASPGT